MPAVKAFDAASVLAVEATPLRDAGGSASTNEMPMARATPLVTAVRQISVRSRQRINRVAGRTPTDENEHKFCPILGQACVICCYAIISLVILPIFCFFYGISYQGDDVNCQQLAAYLIVASKIEGYMLIFTIVGVAAVALNRVHESLCSICVGLCFYVGNFFWLIKGAVMDFGSIRDGEYSTTEEAIRVRTPKAQETFKWLFGSSSTEFEACPSGLTNFSHVFVWLNITLILCVCIAGATCFCESKPADEHQPLQQEGV